MTLVAGVRIDAFGPYATWQEADQLRRSVDNLKSVRNDLWISSHPALAPIRYISPRADVELRELF